MSDLPPCRWRESRGDGTLRCHSEKFIAPPNHVAADFCRTCCYAERGATPSLPTVSPIGPADVAHEMQLRAEMALTALPAYPEDRYRGRGVVLVGGGERFLPSLYVCIRALRHVGCTRPIQLWYLGRNNEMPAARQALLRAYGVECVDADEVRRRHPARNLNGWELKVYATLHSPFEEVLFLDADCYPVRNPDYLFDLPEYREKGAIFWPDVGTGPRPRWPAWGVANPGWKFTLESGQFVLHKKRSWRPLNLAWFYNDHSDYYYRHGCGDKHTFEVAWACCRQPFAIWRDQAAWDRFAFVHHGPAGEVVFIHRNCDKWRLAPHAYVTTQHHAEQQFHPGLPLERECWGWLAEYACAAGIRTDVLNVGCGKRPLPGAVNHDRTRHSVFVEAAWDLNQTPWPCPANSFTRLVADDVLEHLNDVTAFMDEAHRLLKPGGLLRLRVPHWQHANTWLDPTHRRGFHPRSFEFYTETGYGAISVYSTRRWRQLSLQDDGCSLVFVLVPLKTKEDERE